MDGDLHGAALRNEIAELEARIETLSDSIERCRKISLASKLAIAACAGWLVFLMVGLVPFAPYELVAALAAAIGGIVLLGSNATTWTQAEGALQQAEAMRADMIGQIDLRLVGAAKPTLH
jgi:hypothetical protein